MPSLGERLRKERDRLDISQTAAAEACGVTPRSQRNYEGGERLPDAAYLASLANLDIDVMYVLTGKRALTPGLSTKEQLIVEAFRNGSLEQQEFILKAALGFGKDLAETPKATQIFHGDVGQSLKAKKLVQKGVQFSVGGKSKK